MSRPIRVALIPAPKAEKADAIQTSYFEVSNEATDYKGFEILENYEDAWQRAIEGSLIRKQTTAPTNKQSQASFEAALRWFRQNGLHFRSIKFAGNKRPAEQDLDEKHSGLNPSAKKTKPDAGSWGIGAEEDVSEEELELIRPEPSAYKQKVSKQRIAEAQLQGDSALAVFRQKEQEANKLTPNQKKAVDGTGLFHQAYQVTKTHAQTHWSPYYTSNLLVVKKIYDAFEKHVKDPKKKEAQKFLFLLRLLTRLEIKLLLESEVFSNPSTNPARTHVYSPTVLACIYMPKAFPDALRPVLKKGWQGHCFEYKDQQQAFKPEQTQTMKAFNPMHMLRYLACHFAYKAELNGNGNNLDTLEFENLSATQKQKYLPLSTKTISGFTVEVTDPNDATKTVQVPPMQAVCRVFEHMNWPGWKPTFDQMNLLKNQTMLAVKAHTPGLSKGDSQYNARLKQFLFNIELFKMSPMYYQAHKQLTQNKELFKQSNVTTFFKSEIVLFIEDMRNRMSNGRGVMDQVAARILLTQILTGSRFQEVLYKSDFYGNEEYFGMRSSAEDALESTKEDVMIVVAGITKTKKKNAGAVDVLDSDDELEADQEIASKSALIGQKLSKFMQPRVATERIRVLPAKPILFPNRFKAWDIVQMVNYVRQNTYQKDVKSVYKHTQEVFKKTALAKQHPGIKGSHKLRAIYAVYSYDLYGSIGGGEQDTLNMWINKVLGHAIGNLKTSLSYNTSAIKEDLLTSVGETVAKVNKLALLEYSKELAAAMANVLAKWDGGAGAEVVGQVNQMAGMSTVLRQNMDGLKEYVRLALPALKFKSAEVRLQMLYEAAQNLVDNHINPSYSALRQLGFNNNEIKAIKVPDQLDDPNVAAPEDINLSEISPDPEMMVDQNIFGPEDPQV